MSQEEQFLMEWATRNYARFEPEGECGFGRECVGIVASNGHYPAYESREMGPPAEVKDAYHKSDCLAVLGRGEDAIHQLYLWVKKLDDDGAVIHMVPRDATSMVDALIHGGQRAILDFAGAR